MPVDALNRVEVRRELQEGLRRLPNVPDRDHAVALAAGDFVPVTRAVLDALDAGLRVEAVHSAAELEQLPFNLSVKHANALVLAAADELSGLARAPVEVGLRLVLVELMEGAANEFRLAALKV